MRYNISRIFGVLVGIPVAFITWLVTVFAWGDVSFILDVLIGMGGFLLSYFPTQRLTSRKYLHEIGLSRRDYKYVRAQLNHAHGKIRDILKTFINVRSIKDFRQVNDIYRISRSIYMSIKQRPGMFFKVESFFYSHLDNALNLVDAYTRLTRMSRKTHQEKLKLEQTRITLDEVKRTLVADLKRLNEDDYERLDIEMELNKLEQERRKDV
ncbi:5-bromo-4-chloroindolyl phosphate hydrolysis family protein [Staphylococcus saccharolyticus]|uniref:5-bromo-4-chloroindolyl phosphate hydrolysis protein XpaC n=1 Tax=Staphylococcus saccharolyticus TaxID=33028 RepID=A0A380H5Z7_9STAP|nr:5-bromo-4-chloroindolyl phosphate hydrolysis family protein [Staphylococcus saccharolyticus]MBL7565293.1 5-bromo-4-chloroindolyl phosphate hydrolysis family protein [Staphylococcus saccharolyticus]MBL7571649.1 5-bromo-4-chloroindolyl phosphate hydrolysis family protein [Staphylococcus saccharolyticus]QQB98162.1 5-bromo-4-chloroindolyl phosphate hydrolysis family protein [Staphylococcus saccharolyticus]QRJ65986.1 5-bromo-4-chloroindolyl phosphate hydrolysis family protein [Staphylococcus sacc